MFTVVSVSLDMVRETYACVCVCVCVCRGYLLHINSIDFHLPQHWFIIQFILIFDYHS